MKIFLLILSVMGIFFLFPGCGGNGTFSGNKNTLSFFFAGEYIPTGGRIFFHDCTADTLYELFLSGAVSGKVGRKYSEMNNGKGEVPVFCSFYGHFGKEQAGKDKVLVVDEWRGFNWTRYCSPTEFLARTFVSGKDTLLLRKDYSYTIIWRNNDEYEKETGEWGRIKSEQGVLSGNKGKLFFLINEGNISSANNLVISLKNKAGVNFNFEPLPL